MHGLYGKAFRCFVTDTYGAATWAEVAARADLPPDGFEAMRAQPASAIVAAVEAASAVLGKSRGAILVDVGTYLVSHPGTERLRRLLRFGGTDFAEFVHTIEDVPGRARLAVPDLALPAMSLVEEEGRYRLSVASSQAGSALVVLGVLQAMADDYGALVLLEYRGDPAAAEGGPVTEEVEIEVALHGYAEGRRFELGARPS